MTTVKPLTDKERRFVDEFMLSGVAMDAYVKAGYSPKSASSNAHRLMGKEGIIAEIERRQGESRRRHVKTSDDVVAELTKLAFGGMSKFLKIGPNGHPFMDLSGCTADDLDMIAEVNIESYVERYGEDTRQVKKFRLKTYSRLDALTKLAQNFGLLNGKSKNDQEDRMANLMAEIMGRTSTLPVRVTGPLGSKRPGFLKLVNPIKATE